MISRKRPPLVSRSSNAVELDWRECGKEVMTCSEEKEIFAKLIKIADSRIPESEVSGVFKIFLLKLSKLNSSISDEVRDSMKKLMERLSDVPRNTYGLGVVRLLVKCFRNPIEWSESALDMPSLLFLEMIAWDSLSEGQSSRKRIGEKLRKLKINSDDDIRFSLALDRESFLCFDPSNCSGPQRLIAEAGLLSVGVWEAILNNSLEVAEHALETLSRSSKSDVVRVQISLVQSLMGIPSSIDPRNSLLYRALNEIKTQVPLSITISNETRFEVALLSLQLAKHTSDVVKRIVSASFCLHCLKWTSEESEFLSGKEGLLSLLVCDDKNAEKLLQSIIPSVPPLMQQYMAIAAVRIAGEGYEAIGFIPGASWLYHRALKCLRMSNYYSDSFRRKLKRIHITSPTAIADENMDCSLFANVQEEKESESDDSSNRLSEGKLGLLRNLIVQQYALQYVKKSHIERLENLRNSPLSYSSSSHIPPACRGFSVTFLIDSSDNLSLLMRDSKTDFEVSVFLVSNITRKAIELTDELSDLLIRNKSSIASRHKDVERDSTAFWQDRKLFDKELEALILQMENELIPNETNFGKLFPSDSSNLIVLFIPDLLLGLPIEAFSLFRSFKCVRGVCFPAHSHSSVRRAISSSKKFYVLNPNGDCESTETTVKELLEKNEWDGHCGSPTLSDSEFTRMLSDSDVFLFSGHGGGEKHWSGTSVQRLWLKRSSVRAAVLMGCSSARPYGDMRRTFCTPFHYLIGGCWVVCGTLWDVLGRELDRMTADFVANYSTVETIPQTLQAAKRKAKLPNLSAASLVVYVDVAYFPEQ